MQSRKALSLVVGLVLTCFSKIVTSRNILSSSLQWLSSTLRRTSSIFMEVSEHRGESVLHYLIRSWEAPFGEFERHDVNHYKNLAYSPVDG